MIKIAIHEAERFYTSIRRLKHEMRGHLTNIKGLARSGEYASLDDYIAKMDEGMSDFELTLQTGKLDRNRLRRYNSKRKFNLHNRFKLLYYNLP